MRLMRGLLASSPVLALMVVCNAPPALAATSYYVDCSASGNGTGTQASPWNSLATVNARTFAAGDQILFKRGTTCAGQLYPKGSGAPGSPIVADAYGTGAQPEIAGGGTVTDTVYLNNQQYWELRNLAVSNTSATAAQRTGVHIVLNDFGTGNYYRITNLTVHDVSGDNTKASVGITLEVSGTTTPTKFNDVIVDGNEVTRVDRTGISDTSSWNCKPSLNAPCGFAPGYVPWTNVIFRNNTIHDIGGDGLIMRVLDHGLAEHNVAYDINMRSNTNNAGIWTTVSATDTIQYNEAYRVRRPAGTADGMAWDADIGADNTIIQYNYSHDNEGGMVLLCGSCNGTGKGTGAIIRYNVSQNDGSRILNTGGQVDARFYNNTIYLKPGSTTKIVEEGTTTTTTATLANNIFYNLGTGGFTYTPSRFTFVANTFYGFHASNEPADPYKHTSDPLLTAPGTGPSGITLRDGSPALRSGIVMAGNGGKDHFGGSVPAVCQPDRGADQHSAFTDSTCTPIVTNGGFETGSLAPWAAWNSATVGTSPVHNGTRALQLGASPSSAEQIISLQPSTTYVLTGWQKNSATGNTVEIGVKNHGGSQLTSLTGSTDWTSGTVKFTTGPSNTQATIFCYHNSGTGSASCDDIGIVRV